MLRQITPFLQRLFTVFAVLATAAGVMIVVLVVASVAMRHLAQAPFRFTEELVGLLMTTAFFLGLPLVTLNAEHVRVRILVAALPRSPKKTFHWARLPWQLCHTGLFCYWG